MGCCQGKSAAKTKNEPAVAVEQDQSKTTPSKPAKGLHHKTESMIERDIDEFMGVDNSAKRKRRKEKRKRREAEAALAAAGGIEMSTVQTTSNGFDTLVETKDNDKRENGDGGNGGNGGNGGESKAEALQKVVAATGWLFKKGQGKGFLSRRNWKKRYFVLEGKQLRYFTKCSAKGEGVGLKGEMVIMGNSILPIKKADGSKNNFRFDVIQRHPVTRVINLRAETEAEENKWIAAVATLMSSEVAKI
jgi:hypothetical protein